jgi:hypothetical protein
MSYDFGSGVWYGELRASKGNTIVIRDDQLPEANKGRVYLYNTDRDAIIQYDETIVCEKLFPLDEAAQKEAESKFKSSWEAARKQLVRSQARSSSQSESKKSMASDLLPSDDDDDMMDDDD